MSLKGSITTADVLDSETIDTFLKRCIANKYYSAAAFCAAGFFYGLLPCEIKYLKWSDVLSETFVTVRKSKKLTTIINTTEAISFFNFFYETIGSPELDKSICLNRYGGISSIQCVNKIIKHVAAVCHIYGMNITTHTFRKSFGKNVFEKLPDSLKSKGLVMLNLHYSHHSMEETINYIGVGENSADTFKNPFEFFAMLKSNNFSVTDDFIQKYRNPSYVYIMKDSNLPNMVKIGKANNVKNREKTLQGEKPTISLYKYIKLDCEKSAFSFETMLHKRYKEKRIRGEWFELDERQLEGLVKEFDWEDALNVFEIS